MRQYTITAVTTALGLALCAVSTPAQASEPKLEGTFSDWATYSRTDGGDKICYALAQPKTKTPTSVRHGDIYFMVSNWKSGQASEQPSLMTGFPMKVTSPPTAVIKGSRTRMFVAQNEAFIEASRDEQALVRNMKAGATMRVSAVSQRGTSVSYDFSLKGVTAALKKAKQACQ